MKWKKNIRDLGESCPQLKGRRKEKTKELQLRAGQSAVDPVRTVHSVPNTRHMEASKANAR